MKLLGGIDGWTFNSFELDEATHHRPLSTLGFALMKRMGIVECLRLDEARLARWMEWDGADNLLGLPSELNWLFMSSALVSTLLLDFEAFP